MPRPRRVPPPRHFARAVTIRVCKPRLHPATLVPQRLVSAPRSVPAALSVIQRLFERRRLAPPHAEPPAKSRSGGLLVWRGAVGGGLEDG